VPAPPARIPAELTNRTIFLFWIPLAATWAMMAFEGPFLAAVVARLPDPVIGLAAYGVAIAFAVLVESPVIMLMSAVTALLSDATSYRRLRAFAMGLNAFATGLLLVVLVPPVHRWLFGDVLGLPTEVARQTYGALWCFLPWPSAIGYRRFLQGVMIRAGRTRLVAYGTVIRLLAMATAAVVLATAMDLPGAWVGASALSTGVVVEALAARVMARRSIREVLAGDRDEAEAGSPENRSEAARTGTAAPDPTEPAHPEPAVAGPETTIPEDLAIGGGEPASVDAVPGEHGPLELRDIAVFYYPLALTSLLGLSVHPMLTFFMGRSVSPVESLAVFPVVQSLLFVFRALGLSYQDATIALLGAGNRGFPELRRFGMWLALGVSGAFAAIVFTPLADVWFRTISGLSAELTGFALPAARIVAPLPFLGVWLSFERAILMKGRVTRPITFATTSEVAAIALFFSAFAWGLDLVGVTAAFSAFLIGKTVSTLYLVPPVRMTLGRSLWR